MEDEFEYMIVRACRGHPGEAKISDESPVGEALIGKKPEMLSKWRCSAGPVRVSNPAVNGRQ